MLESRCRGSSWILLDTVKLNSPKWITVGKLKQSNTHLKDNAYSPRYGNAWSQRRWKGLATIVDQRVAITKKATEDLYRINGEHAQRTCLNSRLTASSRLCIRVWMQHIIESHPRHHELRVKHAQLSVLDTFIVDCDHCKFIRGSLLPHSTISQLVSRPCPDLSKGGINTSGLLEKLLRSLTLQKTM